MNKVKRGFMGPIRMEADPAQMVANIQAGFEAFKKSAAEADQKIMDYCKAQVEGSGKEAAAALKAANDAALKVQAMADRLVEAEQKLCAGIMGGKAAPQTLGQFVINSDAFKSFHSGATNKMRVEANTIIGQSGSPAENSDVLVTPQRLPGIIPGAFRQLKVRDILPSGTTSSNMVEYTRELAFTNNAAETGEGETKPESGITFELASAPVRTIAHWLKLSKQVLDDAPALASYVDTRLRYGVERRIDAQLLNGNGTGQNLSGITKSGNFTALTPATGDTALDTINKAIYLVLAADYAPTAIILAPADFGAIERTKTSTGEYVIGDPHNAMGPMLWGLPVVVTNSLTAGKVVVGAFDIAHQVWNRQGVAVELTDSDGTDFQKNLVTVRAEARLALAIYRPASVYYGSLEV